MDTITKLISELDTTLHSTGWLDTTALSGLITRLRTIERDNEEILKDTLSTCQKSERQIKQMEAELTDAKSKTVQCYESMADELRTVEYGKQQLEYIIAGFEGVPNFKKICDERRQQFINLRRDEDNVDASDFYEESVVEFGLTQPAAPIDSSDEYEDPAIDFTQ